MASEGTEQEARRLLPASAINRGTAHDTRRPQCLGWSGFSPPRRSAEGGASASRLWALERNCAAQPTIVPVPHGTKVMPEGWSPGIELID
jgi:hypothetical protein